MYRIMNVYNIVHVKAAPQDPQFNFKFVFKLSCSHLRKKTIVLF